MDNKPTSKSMAQERKLGEGRHKLMNAKIIKDVPAQRVLKIEKPTKSVESIEEMVRQMESELNEEFGEFDTNGIVVNSLIYRQKD